MRYFRLSVIAAGSLFFACGGPQATPGENTTETKACKVDDDCGGGTFCGGVPRCLPKSAAADDNGCVVGVSPCQEGQICSESDKSCQTDCPVTKDADLDGHDALECGGDDCDDSKGSRFPGNAEVCDPNDTDEDCDPSTFGYRDADKDNYPDAACCNVSPTGKKSCGTDCDDQESRVHPTQFEACDGLDNDCNGKVDDVDGTNSGYYLDSDGDLYGDPKKPLLDCSVNLEAYVTNNKDCDDTNASRAPNLPEYQCDGIDNNCNGTVDADGGTEPTWFVDADSDGYGDYSQPTVTTCTPPDPDSYTTSGVQDCDDGNAAVHPGATEVCDGIDNNCSSGGGVAAAEDADDDAHTAVGFSGCTGGFPKDDCDDARGARFPGNATICDGLDNDCDELLDPEDDADRDGLAQAGCVPDGGATDCNDSRADTYPGAPDLCDNWQNDCDAAGGNAADSEDVDGDGFARLETCAATKWDCDDTKSARHPGLTEICDGLDNNCHGDVDEGSCGGGATSASFLVLLDQQNVSPVMDSGNNNNGNDSAECPSGTFLVGLGLAESSGASLLAGIQLHCAPLTGSLASLARGTVANGSFIGPAGIGVQSSGDCGGSSLINALAVDSNAGDMFPKTTLGCAAPVGPSLNGGAVTAGSSSTVDINYGASTLTTSCAAGTFAVGIDIGWKPSSGRTNKLSLRCDHIHLFDTSL